MITLTDLIDERKCYEMVRQFRWPNGVRCPRCESDAIIKRGSRETHPERQRYHCHSCKRDFDDLTKSVFSGRHQPLRVWVSCLYLMSLNLSNQQIAKELNLNKDDVQKMTSELRQDVVDKAPEVSLSEEVEFDEVYVTAGHKGQPAAVKKRIARGDGENSKGFGGAARSKRKNHRSLGGFNGVAIWSFAC